ncbi:hypothetical protein GRX03_11450 [Halovenus sp. WSH3]|uniref:Uncharacterized protein n=1 Tax=Halovenus carboxidivorans TaxID=2692199 RepID=A0A6B0T2C2_9EURY|nr:hypothetical protein [Halovenus carboxidivorans]MXR52214.1 hypothetical protein [Halovenus carboxidivorans]
MPRERAVSEIIGYVVVFSLVLLSISVVSFTGLGILEESRDNEQAANAERAFDVVADNMASVYEQNSPSRATEIDLGESELFYADPIRIRVTVDDGVVPRTHEYTARPVELQISDQTSLVYEGGAVFRQQANGGLMIRDPPFLLSEQRVHFPIIHTVSDGSESSSGTTVLLRGKSTRREVLADTQREYEEVTIEITSPRYEIWERYFVEERGLDCTTADQTVSCTIDDPETVFVTHQRIELSIIR